MNRILGISFAIMGAAGSIAATAAPASAANVEVTPVAYEVEVTFDTIRFDNIEDCIGSSCAAEVYGFVSARWLHHDASAWPSGVIGGARKYLNYGGFNAGNGFDSWSTASGSEKRVVEDGTVYHFADTRMCSSDSSSYCISSDQKNNNKVILTVPPNSSIRMTVHATDYDIDSANEAVCNVNVGTEVLNAEQLRTLNTSGNGGSSLPEASCGTTYRIRTIGAVWPTL
ncbi:hypothetical protein ACIGBL_34980 [Streptomyces sp. NPDC085614]|uniref:hypothetical protein n=1 Tax=Streptomyces sp. NPDC085614 TaxID=3365733 RepID=UPI0037D281D1